MLTNIYFLNIRFSLRRADHSSRGVLPIVVRRCVWSRNLKNEEAMTRVGSQRHSKYIYIYIYIYVFTFKSCISYLHPKVTRHSKSILRKFTGITRKFRSSHKSSVDINTLKPELNPICYLLALLGAQNFLHVSRIRVK